MPLPIPVGNFHMVPCWTQPDLGHVPKCRAALPAPLHAADALHTGQTAGVPETTNKASTLSPLMTTVTSSYLCSARLLLTPDAKH